jgi:hypothetical protein
MQEGFDLVEDARNHEPLLKAIAAHDVVATRRAYRIAAETWTVDAQKVASAPVKSLAAIAERLSLK